MLTRRGRLFLSLTALVACSNTADLGGSGDSGLPTKPADSGSAAVLEAGTGDGPFPDALCSNDGGTCGALNEHVGLIECGSALPTRPSGSVLRLWIAYQGSRIGIVSVAGLTKTIPPSRGPLVAGTHSGYWFELRDAADKTIDTRLIQDPTLQEAVDQDGGFTNGLIPECDEKLIDLTVPNDPAARALVFFGSPYGTQLAASELARFRLP